MSPAYSIPGPIATILKAVEAAFPGAEVYVDRPLPGGPSIVYVRPPGMPTVYHSVSDLEVAQAIDLWGLATAIAERLAVEITRHRVLQAKEESQQTQVFMAPQLPEAPTVSFPVVSLPPVPKWASYSDPPIWWLPESPTPNPTIEALANLAPALVVKRVMCPAPACQIVIPQTLAAMIPHLNDLHQWTRERIADWLEGPEFADTDLVLNHAASSGD